MSLEDTIAHGTPVPPDGSNFVVCADGFKMSVVASWATYCTPRPDWPVEWGGAGNGVMYSGPYTHAEMGYPSERPEPWSEWEEYAEMSGDPTGSVYGYVPVEMLRALVELHGGEREG